MNTLIKKYSILSALIFFHYNLQAHFLDVITSIFNSKTINVGYVYIKGVIMDSEELYFRLHKMGVDNAIDAILLVVDSNGTSAQHGHRLSNLVKNITAHKPIVACTIVEALSGGYNIVSACSWIISQPTSNIGGIGTTYKIPKKDDFIHFGSGKFKCIRYKADGVLEEDCAEYHQQRVNQLGELFCKVVSENRKLSFEFIKDLESAYFTGPEALEIGLIDQLGYMEDAIHKIAELVGAKNNRAYTKVNLVDLEHKVLAEYDL